MARELNIYRYILPNKETTMHLCGNSLLNYLNELSTRLIESISIDNYRINANVAKIKLNDALEPVYNQITYIIDIDKEDDKIKYWRCYYVKSASIQSGYIVLSLEIDYWGTYFDYVKISPIHITKSNLRLTDKGIYDDIKATDGQIAYTNAFEATGAEGKGGFFQTMVGMVFLLQYNVSQAVFGTDKITKTELFYINLNDLKNIAVNADASFDDYSAVEIGIDIIGGIYGASANIGNVDAQVIKAWLVDTLGVSVGPKEYGITLKAKSIFTAGHEVTFNVNHVYPSKISRHITIENYDINKIYYAGTFNNGLKLKRFTSRNLDYYTWYIVTSDDVKVIVQQGEAQKDITDAFSVTITTNAGVTTGIRRVAEALSQSMRAYSSVVGNYAKGGVGLAGLGVANDILGMVPNEAYESIIGNGDGATTFYKAQNTSDTKYYLQTPYILTTYTSINNEKHRARLFGANYDVTLLSFALLTLYNFLGTDLTPYTSLPYIKGTIFLNMHDGGIPKDAYDAITNMVANGIYLKFIS